MAPVNLDYQVPWTPHFASNSRSKAARRQVADSARPRPLCDTRGTYDEAVAVQPNLPAVTVSGVSFDKAPRISPDPDLSLCVTGGQDGRSSIDLDVSVSDNTLPPLEQLVESSNKEQPKSKTSPEAIEILPAGGWTRKDKGFCLLASTEQSCDRDSVVNAKCLSSTNAPYLVSPTATTPPESYTSHGSYVSHNFECTSCPVDPALTTCHQGEADTSSQVPDACDPNQSACSLEAFRGGLHGCELDGATNDPSLVTAGGEKRCQIGSETSRQFSPGDEWSDNGLPYFRTGDCRHGSSIRSDNASSSVMVGQTPHLDHRRAEEHAVAMQPPRKRRRAEPSTGTLPSPPASTFTENDADDVSKVAEFEEWALENVLLKRIMMNGVATFQLQFDWNLCITIVA